MSDAGAARVAVASFLKLINLLGAELVVGRHRESIDELESSMRAKLFAHVDGVSPEETAEGVALAQNLIESVIKNLRKRVAQLETNRPSQANVFATASTSARLLN